MTTIRQILEGDHRRLSALLEAATSDPDRIDFESYLAFRQGLLRHIGIEEKILLPEARRLLVAPHPLARRLRVEHGAIASLLVPTPDHALLAELADLLRLHDALEEGEDGVYSQCERILGEEVAMVRERVLAFPPPKMNPNADGPGTYRTAKEALDASSRQGA